MEDIQETNSNTNVVAALVIVPIAVAAVYYGARKVISKFRSTDIEE